MAHDSWPTPWCCPCVQVVTNVCTSHPDANIHMMGLLQDLQGKGQPDVGHAVRSRLLATNVEAPHAKANFVVYGCPFLKPG